MKKTLAMVLAVALVASLCCVLFVSAEDTNLAAGKSYTTTAIFEEVPGTQNWPDEGGVTLTDGAKAPADASYDDPAWVGFNANSPDYDKSEDALGATALIDLEAAADLSKVVFQVYGGAAGISVPHTIKIYTSVDGETYELAGSLEQDPTEAPAGINEYEVAVDATARYVKVSLGLYGWGFVSEIEVFGTAASTDAPSEDDESSEDDEPSEDESSEPEVETVEEVITIDGKLDDTGYTKAYWFDQGVWQTIDKTNEDGTTVVAPVLADIDIKYTTRSDAENIYIAIQVTDEAVLVKELDPAAWDQSGATNFRLWFLGDGMETRTFYDLLWDGEKLVPHREKKATEELIFDLGTDDGVLTLEVKIAKASLNITDSYKMMVTYSAPDFGEGENVGYNAFHMTDFVRGEDGALAEGWSGNDAMYVEYMDNDVILGTYEVEVDKPDTSDEESSEPEESKPEESKPEESKPAESKPEESKPPKTGDAGILVFAVLGVVAIAGAAVAIKARG